MNASAYPAPVPNLDRYANMGGPRSRTRAERIQSSILGKDDGHIHCPVIIRLGLIFGRNTNPLTAIQSLLQKQGFSSADELRDEFSLPEGRLICRPLSDDSVRVSASHAQPQVVLKQALMLGLCTAQVFDPLRPVLWTHASLTRGLELFDPAGFYA